MAKTIAKWHRLDNSAKIYPMLVNKKNQNLFNITIALTQEVQPQILQTALEMTLERFPSFKVKLMKGVFWYYFDNNDAKPLVYPTSDVTFRKITHTNCNGYCFRICYYHNVISADFFHAICDGSGAHEFLKSLLYTYFNLGGNDIQSDKMVKTVGSPIDPRELEDSFLAYYKKVKLRDVKLGSLKGKPAYRVDGILFDNAGRGIIHILLDTAKLLDICHEKKCTMTEFLSALFVMSIYDAQIKGRKQQTDDIQLFLPINLRRIFPSITLRNFSLFSRVAANTSTQMDIDTIIALTHDALKHDLDPQVLLDKISTTVKGEKLIPMRIMPLVLKKLIFRISNIFIGKNKKTATFSNLGRMEMPADMRQFVQHYSFGIGSNEETPLAVTASTTFDELCITFVRSICGTEIERCFVGYLNSYGLNVRVISNFWEVENAL
ncbi:MAG: hypothetical protein RR993_01535 [Clostridia bacterium]